MSLYRPQVGHMQIKKLKKKGAGLRNPYPGISFASPMVDEKQKDSETFALVNNTIIMICIKIAATFYPP